ncbi:putative Ecp2 effector protein domain-containing protein [Seiridium unicorne]|uniref:Ecp2 effector protein domain-containing protein n=1 Tax=Seiridium unicorne TaxID=138068 RepID=A0ABR2UJY6_9PEZI
MQFRIAIILIPGMMFANATPLASLRDYSAVLEQRDMINGCGESTFEDETSGGSALASDCQVIVGSIGAGGTWTVGAGGEHHQLLQHNTCAFGVEEDRSMNAAYIGNADIIGVITDSISKFTRDGKDGAQGAIGCQSLKGLVEGADMTRGIYHN